MNYINKSQEVNFIPERFNFKIYDLKGEQIDKRVRGRDNVVVVITYSLHRQSQID